MVKKNDSKLALKLSILVWKFGFDEVAKPFAGIMEMLLQCTGEVMPLESCHKQPNETFANHMMSLG
jgi:hypothetical protein